MLRRVVPLGLAPLCLALLLGLVAPTLAAAPAFAQGDAARPSISSELPAEARKDWEAAKELFQAGDYGGALIQFKRAYELSKNPRVLFNVGVCEKNLRHYANAIAAWQKQLEFKDKLTPEDEKELNGAIAALGPFVSTLQVSSNEAGATLLINGQEVGETPFAATVPIDVGLQKVTLRKEGFLEKTVTVEVARGVPAKVDFKLEPAVKVSRVTINVTGPAAKIFIDGIDMGPAPFKGQVEVGRHTFEARAPGFETARQTSDVIFNEALSLTLALTEARNEGKIQITTGHDDSIIEIDGRVVGSGAWEGVLRAGGHQLIIRKDGYETYRTDVALDKDQVRTVQVKLEQDRGSTWIWWTLGTVAVVAGGGVASYFVFRPSETAPVTGTLQPGGLVPARWR